MCGRFSLQTTIPDLAELFEANPGRLREWAARFNVAPTEDVVVLRSAESGRELVPLRWGLVPSWADDPGALPLMINARAESLETRRAFRDLIIENRCAVLADGFYEWRTERGVKQPYFVRRRDRTPMALAGLWDVWRGPDGPVASCTIVTTSANGLLLPLHDRMPAILGEAEAQLWLDMDLSERTMDSLGPCESDAIEVFPVSTRVNRVAIDDPKCLAPLDRPLRARDEWKRRPPEGAAPVDQLGLF